MTVAQLIEKLKDLDPDLEVTLVTEERISPCLAVRYFENGTTVFITDDDDDNE